MSSDCYNLLILRPIFVDFGVILHGLIRDCISDSRAINIAVPLNSS